MKYDENQYSREPVLPASSENKVEKPEEEKQMYVNIYDADEPYIPPHLQEEHARKKREALAALNRKQQEDFDAMIAKQLAEEEEASER